MVDQYTPLREFRDSPCFAEALGTLTTILAATSIQDPMYFHLNAMRQGMDGIQGYTPAEVIPVPPLPIPEMPEDNTGNSDEG